MDVEKAVAEIFSVTMEAAAVVDGSPTENVVVAIMPLTLFILLLVLQCLLQDVVLLSLVFLMWKKLRMPIGLTNLASDMRSQEKKNSASQTMVLQKLLTGVQRMTP